MSRPIRSLLTATSIVVLTSVTIALSPQQARAVDFGGSSVTLQGGFSGLTTITVGPEDPVPGSSADGCVYVGEQGGAVKRVCFDAAKSVTSNTTVVALTGGVNALLGISFDPASDPTGAMHLYISYATDNGAPFQGKIAKAVSIDGGLSYTVDQDFIVGLPRSSFDHQTNGQSWGPDGCMYISQGNNSNAGYDQDHAASRLSGAVLRACFNSAPLTLDASFDRNCGGGNTQEACDVEVYASGMRNPYDLTWHSNGKLYCTDNDPGTGFRDDCGNNANTFGCPCQDVVVDTGDELNLIEQGKYYGSPNPYQANPAALQCQGGTAGGDACTIDADCAGGGTCVDLSALCTNPTCGEDVQCYFGYGTQDNITGNDPNSLWRDSLVGTTGQLDGMAEYHAPWQNLQRGAFCSDWDGDLMITPVGGAIRRFSLSVGGTAATNEGNLSPSLNGLDVTVGPDGVIYAADRNAGNITYLVPTAQPNDAAANFFIACAPGEECQGTSCVAIGVQGCDFPPPGDVDCDGLLDGGDPCPFDMRNSCAGPVASCGTGSPQECSAGNPLRLDVGSTTNQTDCNAATWYVDTGNGNNNAGQAFPDPGTVDNYFGCSDTTTADTIVKNYKFGTNICGFPGGNGCLVRSYPIANGTYVVNLIFAEVFNSACVTGSRVSDVTVEGTTVYGGGATGDGVDPYDLSLALNCNGVDDNGATCEPCGGLVVRSVVATVSDGTLDIEIQEDTPTGDNNSGLQAIEVFQLGGCTSDGQCDDGNSCTTDVCNAGTCDNTDLADGTPCDDGDPGTVMDECTAGVCAGVSDDLDNDGIPDVVDPCPTQPLNECYGPVAFDNTAGQDIRINTGPTCSTAVTDCRGASWTTDFGAVVNQSSSVCDLPNACPVDASPLFACTDASTEAIFKCEHWDPTAVPELQYSFDVPDGNYLVNLVFMNSFTGTAAVGTRVFDILVEGALAHDDFDQVAEAGGPCDPVVSPCLPVNRATLVTVADGNGLQIELIHGIENPSVKGIEVLEQVACGVDADCNDGNPCTDNVCTAGMCSNPNNTASCDDGVVCTETDTCGGGVCAGTPNDLLCDDAIACTDDVCNALTGCSSTDNCPVGQVCNTSTGNCDLIADPLRGGLLYDRWWLVNGAPEPGPADHPLYPPAGQQAGSTTYRCKECHGWDYKGASGAYGSGTHFTGIPGVLGSTLTPQQMFDLIKFDSGTVTNGHDFGTLGLSDADINDLVAFLQTLLIDTDTFIDPNDDFIGDPVVGQVHYDTGSGIIATACTSCHGPDGTAINFGTPMDPEWVGTVAVHNPWEFMHKIRFGNPGTIMPSWTGGGGTDQGVADIGAYAQQNFPVDCLGDPCDDGAACTINDACIAGVCVGQDTCPVNEVCNTSTGLCEAAPIDTDNDGMLDANDPCPTDPRNLCFGPVAVDNTTATPVRINAAVGVACSGDKIDCNGDTWFADFGFNLGNSFACNLGGGCPISGLDAIFGVGCDGDLATQEILQCERWDAPTAPELLYSFDLLDGTYVVNLLFANTCACTVNPGDRLFDILIEGAVIYSSFDQVVAAGGSQIAVVRAAVVTVSDGDGLQIEFGHVFENPAIKGIEVLQAPLCTMDADCNDSNPCTDDICAAGTCTNPNNTAPCDDSVACTTGDTCAGGACAGTLDDALCDDTIECTDDVCTAGGCTNDPTAAGTPCTDDGNPCTDNACDGAGGCAATNNTAACDDGVACTTGDICAGGVCAGTPNDALCDDSNDCTVDTCIAGGCDNAAVPDGTPCDDGFPGTPLDQCIAGVCVGEARVTVALVAVPTPTGADEVPALPASTTTYAVGDAFHIEVWAQTVETDGLSSVTVDVGYDASLINASGLTNSAVFNQFTSGTIDNGAGAVDDVGGSHPITSPPCNDQVGLEPSWARVATIDMLAVFGGSQTVSVGDAASLLLGTAICNMLGNVNPAEMLFEGVVVTTLCQGSDETCDGIDDDCSGTADDGYVPTPTACGVGECAAGGTLACIGGSEVDSCVPGAPAAEVCDGLDNDCNGVDDDEPDASASCAGGDFCSGTFLCSGGACVPDMEACPDECEACNPDTQACEFCVYDHNMSGVIDGLDFAFFSGCFGSCYNSADVCFAANYDGDLGGCVGGSDFGLFSGCFSLTCGECTLCFPFEGDPAPEGPEEGVVRVAAVAVARPADLDFGMTLPAELKRLSVGQTFYIEVWARADDVLDGLASVYVDVVFDPDMLEVHDHNVSEQFPNFAHAGQIHKGRIESVGGCAQLGEGTLGLGGEWVRIAVIESMARQSGTLRWSIEPAVMPYGVSIFARPGDLHLDALELQGASVTVESGRTKKHTR